MNYFVENNTISKEGVIGAIVFHLFLLICFLWFFKLTGQIDAVQGMIVNFGTVEASTGSEIPAQPDEAVPTAAEAVAEELVKDAEALPAAADEPDVEAEVLTAESPDAPSLSAEAADQKEKEKDREEKERKAKEAAEAAAKALAEAKEKEREIDPNTLFGNRKSQTDNQNTNQGSQTDPMGDQGTNDDRVSQNSQSSDLYTPSRNIGMGDTGDSFAVLEGRTVVKRGDVQHSKQLYGKIRVKIKVDQKGNVIGADYVAGKSTISDANYKKEAIAAAKKWRFNLDSKKPPVQIGYIDFTFKLN